MPRLNEIIGEEAFKALPEDIRNKHKDTDFVNSVDYVPKDRFTQVNDSMNEYKKQVGERDKQLSTLQGKVKDNEDLTKEIENLKTANATTTADYEKKLQQVQLDTSIKEALKEAKIKDIELAMKLLNTENIKLADGKVIGLNEQIEPWKKDRDYLFEKEVPGTGKFNTGGKSPKGEVETELSFGEKLAKEKTEQLKTSEAASKFFK